MSELSVAEQYVAPFYDPNSVDFLVVSPEDARAAGQMFSSMCVTQISEHASDLAYSDWVPGFAEAILTRQAKQYDGSNVKATITAREELPPDEVRPADFDERENVPGQVVIRSLTGANTADQQAHFVTYSLDPQTKVVRKRMVNPLDKVRILEKQVQFVDTREGQVGISAMFAAHIENQQANRELERDMGIDDSVLVGTAEITALQSLLDSLPVVR
jgi:hypothetical protein